MRNDCHDDLTVLQRRVSAAGRRWPIMIAIALLAGITAGTSPHWMVGADQPWDGFFSSNFRSSSC